MSDDSAQGFATFSSLAPAVPGQRDAVTCSPVVDLLKASLVLTFGGLAIATVVTADLFSEPSDFLLAGIGTLAMVATMRLLRQLERKDETHARLLWAVTNSTDAIIWLTNADGRIEQVHGPADRVLGLRSADIVGQRPDDLPLLLAELEPTIVDRVISDAQGRLPSAGKRQLLRCQASGTQKWFRQSSIDLVGYPGDVTVLLDVTSLVLARIRAGARSTQEANAGGALPRSAFVGELSSVLREASEPKLLTVVQFTRLEQISDLLGRDTSESAFSAQVLRLTSSAPPASRIGRIWGDKLAVLSAIESTEHASAVSGSIMAALDAPVAINGTALDTAPTMRSIVAPVGDHCPETLLRLADVALRTETEEHVLDARKQLELDPQSLRDNLASLIEVWYQPLIDPASGRIRGFEALTRYRPTDTPISTRRLLDILSAFDLMENLDRLVAERAIRDMARLRSHGFDVRMSINVSQRGLSSPTYSTYVEEQCRLSGLDPRFLVVEVSESDLAANSEQMAATLHHLHGLGVSVSLDDFGTGHSTLVQIRDLPVDEVKIDRSFVTNIAMSERDAVIVQSIVRLARDLGIRVVAEGVEDQRSLAKVMSYGVDLVQGFYYAPAEPLGTALRSERLMLR